MARRNLGRAMLAAWTQGSGDDVVRACILFLSGGKAEGNNTSAFPLSLNCLIKNRCLRLIITVSGEQYSPYTMNNDLLYYFINST
jgi:hypothetical protein